MRDMLLDELAKGADASWRLALDSAVSSARGSLLTLLGVRSCRREYIYIYIFICNYAKMCHLHLSASVSADVASLA